MATYDIDKPLRTMVASAKGPEDITDPFCFVVGFVSGEIKQRMALLFDDRKMTAAETRTFEAYQTRLSQLEKAWDAFVEEKPGSAAPLIAGREAARKARAL